MIRGSLGLIAIAALSSTQIATAQSRVGPEIAYSRGNEVFLVNPDGTGKVRVYRASGNNFIDSVSLKPGGGAIALIDNGVIRFVNYDNLGRQVGMIRSLASSCSRLSYVSYHPDGNSVLFNDTCGSNSAAYRSAVPSAADPQPTRTLLLTPAPGTYLTETAWDPAGTSFVYHLAVDGGYELRRRHLDGTDQLVVASVGGRQLRFPDVTASATGSRIVVSDWHLGSNYPGGTVYTSEVDGLSGASIRANFITGSYGRYSPAGDRVLYIALARNWKGRALRIHNANGSTSALGVNDTYHAIDWGN